MGLSIPEQLRQIRSFAELRGIEIVAEFSEAASAFQQRSRRPEFWEMLAAARRDPEVCAILVHDLSRFSRDSLGAAMLVRELHEAGIRVISLNDPDVDPDTVAGVYLQAITFAKNEAYSREIGFHMRKGCEANLRTRDPETGWCYKNGGRPLWGYRPVYLYRGERRRNHPIIKLIWELDDTPIGGRGQHEWVRHCLLELAAKGASLRDLCCFCERTGIPARRAHAWCTRTWRNLLRLNSLLQYAGYGVWGVHGDRRRRRPPSEWVVVGNAHPAILTSEELRMIVLVRHELGARGCYAGFALGRAPHYLLGEGLFRCGGCGRAMAGFRRPHGTRYYACSHGAPASRRSHCGRGVHVRQEYADNMVVEGLRTLLDVLGDASGLLRTINQELRTAWRRTRRAGQAGGTAKGAVTVEAGCESSEGSRDDANTSHSRTEEPIPEEQTRTRLSLPPASRSPRISATALATWRQDAVDVLVGNDPREKKRAVRAWVEKAELDPERREVSVLYRIPEQLTRPLATGAWCRDNSSTLATMLGSRWALPPRMRGGGRGLPATATDGRAKPD